MAVRRIAVPVRHLSGGNRQRLLVAREIDAGRRLLIAAHPTAGIDVAATREVWRSLLEARGRRVGVLLISEDLEEVFSLADRILVIYEGQIVGEFSGQDVDRDAVGLLMGGSRGAHRDDREATQA
jgi:simple sugar transport system ATP-binding protein